MTNSSVILTRSMLVGMIFLIVSGCAPGRKTQCRELGNATHKVMGQVEAIYQSQIGGNAYDPEFELKLAEAWEIGADKVADANLSDKTLKTLQDDLAMAYQQAAALRRQAAELIPKSGLLSAEEEVQVDALHLQSEAGIPPAINELNLYCIGG